MRRKRQEEKSEVQVNLNSPEASSFFDTPSICNECSLKFDEKLGYEMTEVDIENVLYYISLNYLNYVNENEMEDKYGVRGKWKGLVNEIKEKNNCVFCYLEKTTFMDDVVNAFKREVK